MNPQFKTDELPAKAPTQNIILNYGLLMAILSIALQVISYVLDAHIDRPWWLSVVQMAITIGIIVMGIRSFKTENAGFISLSEALKVGIGISLIASLIVIIYNFIFMTFIEPDLMQKTLEFTRRQMEEQGQLSQEQIEMSMKLTEKFMSPWIINAIAILGALFFGFIISLITGLAIRRTPDQPYQ